MPARRGEHRTVWKHPKRKSYRGVVQFGAPTVWKRICSSGTLSLWPFGANWLQWRPWEPMGAHGLIETDGGQRGGRWSEHFKTLSKHFRMVSKRFKALQTTSKLALKASSNNFKLYLRVDQGFMIEYVRFPLENWFVLGRGPNKRSGAAVLSRRPWGSKPRCPDTFIVFSFSNWLMHLTAVARSYFKFVFVGKVPQCEFGYEADRQRRCSHKSIG